MLRPALSLIRLLLLGLLPSIAAGAVTASKAPPGRGASWLEVVAVEGDAQVRDQLLLAGATLAPGDEVRAGKSGHVRLKLGGESSVSFWGPGHLVVGRMRRPPPDKGADISLRLGNGRIEVAIRRTQSPDSRVEIQTSVASILTRGALFRVTAAQSQSITCEVAEGSVQVADSANQGSVSVAGGFGTRVASGGPPMKPVALLSGPRLWTGIQLVEEKSVEIPFSPLLGAVSYRMIVSPGEDLYRHLVEQVVRVARLRIAGLADGDYFVRVRAIDEYGLEGAGSIVRMRVQVRPDPPILAHPPDRSRLYGRSAELSWLPDADAVGYVVQLAEDDRFRSRSREWTNLLEPKLALTDLRPGSYYWRVASKLKNGLLSRASAPSSFQVAPAPVPPAAPRNEDGKLRFQWTGQPGQKFLLQLSADPRFEYIVEARHADRPAADIPLPRPGTYFARLRTTEPNGLIGPFTDAIRIEVSSDSPKATCLVQGERGLCAVYAPAISPPR